MTRDISRQALQRLPIYLNYLKTLENVPYISAPTIAHALDLNEVQVRKDLAAISENSGVPKKGFSTKEIISSLYDYLGYNNTNNAILIGAGKLGLALLSYEGFDDYGLNIVAAFDADNTKANQNEKIYDISLLPKLCERLQVKIAIITTPASEAQKICNILIENGILAIWNFAPVHLKVPDNILVQNENMASSLALLSNHLREKLKG